MNYIWIQNGLISGDVHISKSGKGCHYEGMCGEWGRN